MRIIIADHQPKVRFALRVALEQQPGFKTVSEAIDTQDLFTQVDVICPDLAIIDWTLPGLPIADLVFALRAKCRDMHIIVLSSQAEMRKQALLAGANAFVCMCDAPDELSSAIATCLATKENYHVRNDE